jgi:SAM-dependent methyltransferase
MTKVDFFKEGIPDDFAAPTALPAGPEQAGRWQEQNRAWWERNPMKYDETELTRLAAQEGSPEFFAEIDRRFFRRAEQILGWRKRPFDTFIDFAGIARQRVLEVGVGCGSHAGMLAASAKSFAGVDLTDYATRMTNRRLALAGRPGLVSRMDGERLAFASGSFDFIWSWGVIHHSSNTRAVLEEMHRVLRPGGVCTCMVYHWSPWNAWFRGALYYGVLRRGFLRTRSIHRLLQETTDGAIARYYTRHEWRALVSDLFAIESMRVLGHKEQFLPLPAGRLKERLARAIPDRLGRWLANRPAVGFMLVVRMRKPAGGAGETAA